MQLNNTVSYLNDHVVFFLELTLPYLCSWCYTLTHLSLILYMDLDLPCLKSQPYSWSPLSIPGALWGTLSSFPMCLHMKVLHMPLLFLLILQTFLNITFFSTGPPDSLMWFYTLILISTQAQGTPQYLTSILSIKGWLGEPIYHSLGSSQVKISSVKLLLTLFFIYIFIVERYT